MQQSCGEGLLHPSLPRAPWKARLKREGLILAQHRQQFTRSFSWVVSAPMTAGPVSIQTLSLLIAPQTRGAMGSTPLQSLDLDQDPDFCRAPVLHLGLGLCSGQPQSPAGHGPLTHHCHGTCTGEPPGEPPHRRSPQPAVQFVPITQRIDKKLFSGPTKCPP